MKMCKGKAQSKYWISMMVALMIICFVAASGASVNAATVPATIRFSNIGNTTNNPPAGLPITQYDTTAQGLRDAGRTLVKITDLAYKLGATISYNPYDSTEWRLIRNGQTVKFWDSSTYFSASVSYSITNPATSNSTYYAVSWYGYSDIPAQTINGEKYVRLTSAANQLGTLIVGYDSPSGEARVFDWRIYNSSPLSDDNTYVVGGTWIDSWSSKGTTSLASHFTVSELWDKSSSSSNPTYYSQLKISVNQLQSAENVRYYYNNNSAMTLSSAFRSWNYNNTLSGSWVKSFHMRGRAWDAPKDSLYTSVYNEFKGTYSQPLDPGGGFWRTRVTNGLSKGYEIEKMPQGSGTWLHLQRTPEYGSIQ